MAISVVTTGAWIAPTARTSTVTLPTHSAGQLVIVRIGWKSATPTTDVAVCNTSGWSKLGQYYNGGGASGNGSGGVLVAAFYKILTSSSETNPVIEYDDATLPTPGALSYVLYSCGSDEMFVAPEGASGNIAAATSYSATMSTHVSAKTGDVLDAFAVTNDNTTLTVPTVSQAGLTLDTVTENPATALSSASSNDISADACYRTATAGTSSAAAVVSGTNSVADPGAAWVTRLRVNKLLTIPLLDASRALYAPTVIPDQLVTLPLLESMGGVVRGTAFALDDFSGSSAGAWPAADTGGSWTGNYLANYGSMFQFGEGGGVATMTGEPPNDQGSQALTAASDNDVDIELVFGAIDYEGQAAGIAWRILTYENYYYAKLTLNADNYLELRVFSVVSSVETQIGTTVTTALGLNTIKMRVAAVGSAIKVKAWYSGNNEPATWDFEATDSTYTASGDVGVVGIDVSSFRIEFLDFGAYAATLGVSAPALFAPVVEGLAPSGPQTVTLGLLDASAALYAPSIHPAQFVTLGLLESTPALYAPTLTPKNTVTLGLLESTPALYQPTVKPTNTLTPPLLDAGPALYQPTLTPKNTLTLGLLESTPALYAPALAPQPVTITLGLLDAAPDLFAPTVAKVGGVTQDIILDLLDATAALYAPTVLPQPVTIQLDLLDATAALYAPTLAPKNTLTLGLLDASAALYAPVVTPTNTLTLGLLTSTSALYAPTLAPQPVTLTLGLLESTPALYEPTLVPVALTIVVPLLDSGPALYAPAVLANQLLTIPLLDAGPALYQPTVTPKNTVTLGLLESTPALFAPTLYGYAPVTLPLLNAGPDLFAPAVTKTSGVQDITLGLLDAGPGLYAPALTLAPYPITVPLLTSTSALYQPTIKPINTLQLGLIDASGALYAPTIIPGAVAIIVPLLDGGSALYAPTFAQGQAITLGLLDGSAALYAPTLYGYVPIVLPLLDGAGELYPPVLQNVAVFITGITRDSNGTPLGSVEVHVFRTSDDVEVAQVTSNALGVFSIQVQGGIAHYIVAYKTGTPDRAGTTLNTLVGS